MDVALADFAATLPDALIALDFDGPIAPIINDPQKSRPVPGAIDTLAALARSGVQIAVVTGRDAETVLELGQLAAVPGLIVSGVHGAETWHGGTLHTRTEPDGLAELRNRLPALLAEVDPDAWLEDKRLSLVVHTRRTADPSGALAALTGPVADLAERAGLEAHPGKMVLEIRIPNLSKADAMNTLLATGRSGALFAGDDIGDLPAFAAVRAWAGRTGHPGVTIGVGENGDVRAATDVQLDSAYELFALLGKLAEG
ncbi:MAG TPA: trehalose-phosphatase [Micromonosporaceae bacterium]|jgi:trehalose 6-phosphate phosphatase